MAAAAVCWLARPQSLRSRVGPAAGWLAAVLGGRRAALPGRGRGGWPGAVTWAVVLKCEALPGGAARSAAAPRLWGDCLPRGGALSSASASSACPP